MKKIILIALSLLTLIRAQDMTGRDIMGKSKEAQTMSGTEYIGTLTIYDNKGNQRIRKIAAASKDYSDEDVSKRIIRFLEPADVRGTGMLIFDYDNKNDDMWIYMPSLRKTRRIVSSDKGKSFMGSEFSNADMAAENMNDFEYNLLGEADFDNIPCWKIEITPIDEDIANDNGYTKKIVWIAKSDYIMRHAEFYDIFDDLYKKQTNSNIRLLDQDQQKYQAGKMEMINVQNGRKSIMNMDNIQFNPNVKDEYFTLRYLEKM